MKVTLAGDWRIIVNGDSESSVSSSGYMII